MEGTREPGTGTSISAPPFVEPSLLGDTVIAGAFEGDEVNEDEVDLEEYEPGATV